MRTRLTVVLLASTLLALGALPAAEGYVPPAPVTVVGQVASLREVTLTRTASYDGAAGDGWRAGIDGDEDGSVSATEYAVFVSAYEGGLRAPDFALEQAYVLVWGIENASGATFTITGRADLASLVVERAAAGRLNCTLDGVLGAVDRVALAITNLTGPLSQNLSVDERLEFRLAWAQADKARALHRLDVETPPLAGLSVAVAGGFVILRTEYISGAIFDSSSATVTGYTTGRPSTILFSERHTTSGALALAAGAILLGTGAAGGAAIWSARRHAVADRPLPVAPKHK